MTLAEAVDFLAGNCPKVFAPIALELESLRDENKTLKADVVMAQEVLDVLIMGGM